MSSEMILWQPEGGTPIPNNANTAPKIVVYAEQLTIKDRRQLVSAFNAGHFEMGLTFLWTKTHLALKKELSAVGVGLLGEMLGRVDVNEDDDIDDLLTPRDAIRLAGELGIVSSTDAMRLQHTYELITHFSQLNSEESASEEIDASEAVASLKACVKAVLARPKVEVATKFVEFRDALEAETLAANDTRIEMLIGSPYFFWKLTISVLMNASRRSSGAQLEHALANTNTLLPAMWGNLRDGERWQVGRSYAEAYANGRASAVSGLRNALLKVKGFDFVPENLRSETFIKAADAILKAHDGMNNFYNEYAPVNNLAKLGSTIPTPALALCMTALLSVCLGNKYGVAFNAQPEAKRMLSRLSADRWQYYLNQALLSDVRILSKLRDDHPLAQWLSVFEEFNLKDVEIKNRRIARLMDATGAKSQTKIRDAAASILKDFYGKPA